MKLKLANLQANVVSVYDPTKTFRAGRVTQKTINTRTVLGPPLTRFIDTFTDSGGQVIAGPAALSENNRLFVLTAITAAAGSLLYYNFDTATGTYSYQGRVILSFPNSAATTHTTRYIRAVDQVGTTGWKIFIGTVGSVTVNGGNFVVHNLAASDFSTGVPSTIFMAIASNTKAVYMAQDPAGLGVANNMQSIMGAGYNISGNEIIVTNGSAASIQHFGLDTTATPTITTYTTTAATTSGSPTFTMTGHPFVTNDQVVITSNAPTGFTATSTAQTVYFINNPTANTFELKATTGGASINATSVTSGTTIVRAFGQTTSYHIPARKTGVITTGFAGTALLIDCQRVATMFDGSNAGQLCYYFPTTTNFYCWRLTDITTGATTLPTASGINATGTGTDVTTITAVAANYSEILGLNIYSTAAFGLIAKRWVNSQLYATFGSQINTWLENSGRQTDQARGFAVAGIVVRQGWAFIIMTTTGQRGILAVDLRSDTRFDYSYVVTPVMYVGAGFFKDITTLEQLYEITDTTTLSYRTAATSTDPIFSTEFNNWTVLPSNADLSTVALNNYVQIKINYDIMSTLSGTPSQIEDVAIGYKPNYEMSDKWVGSVDNTSMNGGSPAYTAFRMVLSDSGTKYFRAFDDNGNLVASANTSANFALFDKTTNNGTSWTPMSGANDYSSTPLTTEIRYKWASPPGVRVTCSLSDS